MNAKDMLGRLGGLLIGIGVFVAGVVAFTAFVMGAAWASEKLLPLFSNLSFIIFGMLMLVVPPLAVLRATRRLSSKALFGMSYVFGITLWMEGLLLCLTTWGIVAVFVGIMLAGVGIVPIAMLATMVDGKWGYFIELTLLTVATFGTRIGAMLLAESVEERPW